MTRTTAAGVAVGRPTAASDGGASRFPCLPGALDVDVLVIGGGLRGLVAATLLTRSGARVGVVDGARIGRGRTATGSGAVTALHGLCYATLVDAHGPDAAGAWAQANVDAVGVLAELLAGTGALHRADAVVHAGRASDVRQVERELRAVTAIGLPVQRADVVDGAAAGRAAIRLADQAWIDPQLALDALADRLVERGALLFEGTVVDAVERDGARLRAVTRRGPVRARHVIHATGGPHRRRGGVARHAVAVRVDGAREDLVLAAGGGDRSTTPHRSADGRSTSVVIGAPHPADGRSRFAADGDPLERHAVEELGGELTHRWVAHDLQPVRKTLLLEPSRTRGVHVLAPSVGWGVAAGVAAACAVADHIGHDGSRTAAALLPPVRRRGGPPPRDRVIWMDRRERIDSPV